MKYFFKNFTLLGFFIRLLDIRMKNILIANQKGGSGKSTLADLILWEFEKDGIPASFYDLDGQGGVIHETYENPDAQVAVIDTPGALQADMSDWIKSADLIIIPSKTTMLDVKPLQRMIDLVQSADCEKVYVEMMWNRYTTAKSFDEWLIEATNKESLIFRIPQSEMMTQAAAVGMSVIDYVPKSNIAQICREFVVYIEDLLELK